jgi:hypothetical protein
MTAPYESADDVRARVCGHKRRWATPGEARRQAALLVRDQGGSVGHYRCPFCSTWHVGHVPSLLALEAIARVIRGLDPTAPQPHDPPSERERHRRRRKDQPMTDLTAANRAAVDAAITDGRNVPADAFLAVPPAPADTDLPGRLGTVIVATDDRRHELAEHGDWHALAFLLAELRRLQADLRLLIDTVEQDCYRLLPDKRTEIDGLGVLEKRKGTDRRAWQSIDLLDEILRVAVVDRETGVVLDDETMIRQRIHEVLVDAVPFNPSLGWRVTALRELGLDPDEWCETKPGRESVQVVDNRSDS